LRGLSRGLDAMKTDGDGGAPPGGGAGTSERSFKYAVIAYAVVEFFAIALALWYGAAR
jgi:hypothetical protein